MMRYHIYLLSLLLCIGTTAFAQSRPMKVACLGNSVTFGAGLTNRDTDAYPAKLQQLLGDRYHVRNFGHNGATLLRKGHNPYDKTDAFSDALAYVPDVAIIHLGLNDTDPRNWPNYRDEFMADYAWLIDTIRQVNPSVRIYICQLTPIFSGHRRFKSGTRDWYRQIQATIPRIAEANDAQLIKLNKSLFNRPDLFEDHLHPDSEGASIIAQTVYAALTGDVGGLQLPPVFTDHMVLQRQQPIPIYGKANIGTPVSVAFNGKEQTVTADDNGDWKALFPAMEAGGPYTLAIRNRDIQKTFTDILIGDVWLCSGQSNMAFPLRASIGADTAIKHTSSSPLRLLQFKPRAETNNVAWDSLTLDQINKLSYFSGTWQLASTSSSPDFSAIGYAFGQQVAIETGVPIGLIQLAVGGSPIESWIDRQTMEQDARFVDIFHDWKNGDFIQEFCRDRAKVNLQHATKKMQRHPYDPCYNYEAGISTLLDFPIKGVLWYQGESNTHNIELYKPLFHAMVDSWRSSWGAELPFYTVQLSSMDRPSWSYFRLAQRELQREISNVWMAVSSDLGDSLDVHPRHKLEIGNRLALLALKHTYGHDIVAEGPRMVTCETHQDTLVLSFERAKQLTTRRNEPLTGFELVDDKGRSLPVAAFIKGKNVLIAMPKNFQPAQVRYAWQPFTRANLENELHIPAAMFVTQLH